LMTDKMLLLKADCFFFVFCLRPESRGWRRLLPSPAVMRTPCLGGVLDGFRGAMAIARQDTPDAMQLTAAAVNAWRWLHEVQP
jgi:hypothetical protein